MRKSSKIACALIIALVAMTTEMFAQGTFSRFTGVVQDQNGQAVPNASVTLTNEGTGISQTVQTSGNGTYVFDSIQVGTYRLTVEKAGFKKFTSGNNPVDVNKATTLDVNLEVGGVDVTVEVTAAASLVETSSSGNLGVSIEQNTLEALPIVQNRGRNPLDLINTQPGVVNGANTGGGIHVHGSRDRAFNFTLDGVDINETSAGGSNFTPIRLNPDAIQQFSITTGNFTADLGRSSGAAVGAVVRPGTNDFTGTLFEFYQTPRFRANEYESNLNGLAKRQLVQHIFGGSIGGPIVKNRAFFFTNLQLLRATETRPITSTVYTASARQGLFRYAVGRANIPFGATGAVIDAAGNVLPGINVNTYNSASTTFAACGQSGNVCGLDPAVQRILALTPLPNNFTAGDGLNTAGYTFNAPQREKQYDWFLRLDYKFNDDHQVYGRYYQGQQNTFGDFGNSGWRRFPDTPDIVSTFRDPKNLAVNYRWNISSRMTNELIYGYNRFGFSFNNPDENFASNPPIVLNLPTDPLNNTPPVNNARILRTHQFIDNLTFVAGDHTIKGGVNLRFQSHKDDRRALTTLTVGLGTAGGNSVDLTGNPYDLPALGVINANDRARLLSYINDMLGRIRSVSRSFVSNTEQSAYLPANEGLLYLANYPEYDFYIQDTWKARRNITIDAGVRFEARYPPSSEGYPILRPNRAARFGETATNALVWEEGDLFKSKVYIAPSIGIAWDPKGDSKTSVRANYRIAYDRLNTFVFSSSIFQTTPGITRQETILGTQQSPLFIRNGIPALSATASPLAARTPPAYSGNAITVFDPDMEFPQNHQWFAGVQRDLGWNIVAEVNYIGRRGVHLAGGYDANQVDIFAKNPNVGNESFLDAFRTVRAGGNSPFINLLYTGSAANNAGTTTFRSNFLTDINNGNVGSVAFALSQRLGAGTLASANGFNSTFFQPYPQFTGGLNVLDSNDFSLYNGLEFILKRRFKDGLSFQASYTLSKSKDTRSFDPAFTTVGRGNAQSSSSTPFNNADRRFNYALSDFDRRHVIQAYSNFDIPVGRGRRFGREMARPLDWIIGGWQLAGFTIFQSGRPFTVFSGFTTYGNVVQSTANCNGCPRNLGQLVQEAGTNYFISAAERARFTSPAPGELGNTGRNYFIGPRNFRIDLAMSKKFNFTERMNFELRVESQNLTNTPSFGFPTAVVNSPTFGRIRDNVLSFSRRIQFAGKFNF